MLYVGGELASLVKLFESALTKHLGKTESRQKTVLFCKFEGTSGGALLSALQCHVVLKNRFMVDRHFVVSENYHFNLF